MLYFGNNSIRTSRHSAPVIVVGGYAWNMCDWIICMWILLFAECDERKCFCYMMDWMAASVSALDLSSMSAAVFFRTTK